MEHGGGAQWSQGGVPDWALALLVEASVPLLVSSLSRLGKECEKQYGLRRTRRAVRRASSRARATTQRGLGELLLEDEGGVALGVFRGRVEPASVVAAGGLLKSLAAGLASWSSSSSNNSKDPDWVVRLRTEEVCFKHFSPRRLGDKVTYRLDRWSLDSEPFVVRSSSSPSDCVRVPRLRADECERAVERCDLAPARAARLPLSDRDASFWQRIKEGLVRQRYASHCERRERCLRRGTDVTVVGKVRRAEANADGAVIEVVPCEDCGVYVTERTPPELLRDLDREVLRSAFRAAGYALASVAIAGFLLSYIYVVCSDLREALQRKKKKKGGDGGRSRRHDGALESSEEEEEGEGDLCCVCLSRRSRHVLVPCGHCCVCGRCVVELFAGAEERGQEPRCPICRSECDHSVRVYN